MLRRAILTAFGSTILMRIHAMLLALGLLPFHAFASAPPTSRTPT
jgi:hypothetical protein